MSRIPSVSAGLKACRVRAGLSQQQLADAIGRDKAYVSRVENGHITPDVDTYHLWIEVTNSRYMMFSYIYGDDGLKELQFA